MSAPPPSPPSTPPCCGCVVRQQKMYSPRRVVLDCTLLHYVNTLILDILKNGTNGAAIALQDQFFSKRFPCTRKCKAGVFQISRLKSVFGKLRFREGLVWTVGLTVEIKLRFLDGLVWTVSLTVEIKLHFRHGLVWTVELTAEIKLRFRISWHIVKGT